MEENKKKVLIAEDEELVSRLYQAGLKNSSFEVVIARDGQEALDKAREIKPDLILLDFMMPKLNGIQVLEQLRTGAEFKHTKIIMMTNLSGDEDRELAKSKGADDYWVKRDVQPNELEKRIGEILGRESKSG